MHYKESLHIFCNIVMIDIPMLHNFIYDAEEVLSNYLDVLRLSKARDSVKEDLEGQAGERKDSPSSYQ